MMLEASHIDVRCLSSPNWNEQTLKPETSLSVISTRCLRKTLSASIFWCLWDAVVCLDWLLGCWNVLAWSLGSLVLVDALYPPKCGESLAVTTFCLATLVSSGLRLCSNSKRRWAIPGRHLCYRLLNAPRNVVSRRWSSSFLWTAPIQFLFADYLVRTISWWEHVQCVQDVHLRFLRQPLGIHLYWRVKWWYTRLDLACAILVTRTRHACVGVIVLVFCGLHKPDLVVQPVYKPELKCDFYSQPITLIGHLRRQQNLIAEMRSTCVKVSDVRRISICSNKKRLVFNCVRVQCKTMSLIGLWS